MDREYIENDRPRKPRRRDDRDGDRPRKRKKKKKRNGPPQGGGGGGGRGRGQGGRREKKKAPLSALAQQRTPRAQNNKPQLPPRQENYGPPPARGGYGGGYGEFDSLDSDGYTGAIGGPASSFRAMGTGGGGTMATSTMAQLGNSAFKTRELFDDSLNRNERADDDFIPGKRAENRQNRRFGRPKIGRPKIGIPKVGMPKLRGPKLGRPKVGIPRLGRKKEDNMPLPPENYYEGEDQYGGFGGGFGAAQDSYGYKEERNVRNDREFENQQYYDDGYGYGQANDKREQNAMRGGGEQGGYGGQGEFDGRSPAPKFDERRGVYELEGGDLPRKFGCTIQCYCYLPTPVARLRRRFCG